MPGGFKTLESIPFYPRAEKGKQKAGSSEEEAAEADAKLNVNVETEWHEYAYSAVTRGSDEDPQHMKKPSIDGILMNGRKPETSK